MKQIEKLVNVRKKILAYATIATLGGSVLTGCDEFAYNKDVRGGIEVTGTISIDSVCNLKLIHLSNSVAKTDEYILTFRNLETGYSPNYTHYYDVETDREVYNDNENGRFHNFNVKVIVEEMYDYLYKYDMIKDNYTIEDIKKLKENLLNDPDLNLKTTKNKKLVK